MTGECQSKGYSLGHKNRMHRLFVKKKKKKERERERSNGKNSEPKKERKLFFKK